MDEVRTWIVRDFVQDYGDCVGLSVRACVCVCGGDMVGGWDLGCMRIR